MSKVTEKVWSDPAERMRVTWSAGDPPCYEVATRDDCLKNLTKDDLQRLRRVLNHVLGKVVPRSDD